MNRQRMLRPKQAKRLAPGLVPALAVVALVAAAIVPNLSAENWIVNAGSDSSVLVENKTRLKNLDSIFTQAFLPAFGDDLKVASIVQRFPIDPRQLDERAAKGKGRATFDCFSQTGSRGFGGQTVKFDPFGNAAAAQRIPGSANCDFAGVNWAFRGSQKQPAGTSVDVRTSVQRIASGADPDCFDKSTLCLGADNRFKVEVDWRSPSGSGAAIPLPSAIDTGTFWFFDPDNVEMVLKVLDGCNENDRFWVFAGALTNVEVDITVEDTVTSRIRTYTNPLNTPFQPIQDTQAFATCP